MSDTSGSAPRQPVEETSSRRRKAVLVQASGFRCMAYQDEAGRWRDYFNNEEIAGRVVVVPFQR